MISKGRATAAARHAACARNLCNEHSQVAMVCKQQPRQAVGRQEHEAGIASAAGPPVEGHNACGTH